MKRQERNPLKKFGFIYKSRTGEEFQIIEMYAFEFLSVLEIILNFKNIDNPELIEKFDFIESMKIPKKLKIELLEDELRFQDFYKKFLMIHFDLNSEKREEEKPDKKKMSFFDNALKILITGKELIGPDLETVGNKYTWRFINKCIKVVLGSEEKSSSKEKGVAKTSKGEIVKKQDIAPGIKKEVERYYI